MGKKDLSFIPGLSDDERILLRNILDKYERANRICKPLFSFFLDERKQMLAKTALDSIKADRYIFEGGYQDAQRKIIVFYPEHYYENEPQVPVKSITFTYRAVDKLTHRDFLGALMSLDIKRECIGDILVGEGKCCVFVYETVLQDVLYITKIGRVGVKASEGFDVSVTPENSFKELSLTVSSLRIDGVVSAAAGISREKAAALIKSSLVSLNYKEVSSASQKIDIGGTFSARGYGKYELISCRETKKGRLNIVVKKYL